MVNHSFMEPSIKPDGTLHIDIHCPKCGAELTDLDFERKKVGNYFIWHIYHKCPKCGFTEKNLT